MGALLCVLSAGGHSHSGHEAMSTRGKCKTQFTYADPQLSKAPKPLPLSSLQEALYGGVPTGYKEQSTTTEVHNVFSSYTIIPPPPLFLHSGKIHY